jgi:hypothetical protein
LKSGVNVINVKARSKFNKEDTKSLTINADFQSPVTEQPMNDIPDQNPQSVSVGDVSLEIYVSPNPTWMSIESDGNLVYSGVLLPQSVQKFDAKEDISITSGNGKETYVKINGKDLGKLSNDTGVVRDVIYNANGKVDSAK